MAYLTLDITDERLRRLAPAVHTISLLYCMRCALCWKPFSYHVRAPNEITLIEANRGERDWEEFYQTAFPRRAVELQSVAPSVEPLDDLLNMNVELTDDQVAQYFRLLGRSPEGKIGADIRPRNQVGGRPFFQQRLIDPLCPTCVPDVKERADFQNKAIAAQKSGRPLEHAGQMYFLASIVNDKTSGIAVYPIAVQVVFFICPTCTTITVQHSVD